MYLKSRLNALRYKSIKTKIKIPNKNKKTRHRGNEESLIQQSIIELSQFIPAAIYDHNFGSVREFLFSIPNGGSRHKIEAIRLKKEGITPGVSDLFFALPVFLGNRSLSGLWVEVKSLRGKLSSTQRDFLWKMQAVGYGVCVVRSLEEFQMVIKKYLIEN